MSVDFQPQTKPYNKAQNIHFRHLIDYLVVPYLRIGDVQGNMYVPIFLASGAEQLSRTTLFLTTHL